MIRRFLLLFLISAAACFAQQNTQVVVPQQLFTVPVVVNGLPAGCTFAVAGGTQVTITVSGCTITTPPPPPPPPPTPGVLAIGAVVTIVTPCPSPCHLWPTVSATAGVSGTPVNITAGMTGTITAGPITNTSGTWWQVKLANGAIGWTTSTNYVVSSSSAPSAVKLSWTPSDSANVTGYNVYRGTVSTALSKLALCLTNTFTDSTALHGPTYFYAVTALGDPKAWTKPESSYSNILQVTP
jgi:hypothetical protein